MTKNTMSWIIVMLLVFIIVLLSVCIYLDIEFTATFTSSSVPDTTASSTSSQLVHQTTQPIEIIKPSDTTKTPASSNPPVTTALPAVTGDVISTTIKPISTQAPLNTTQAPISTEAPQTTSPIINPDAPTVCIDAGHGFSDPGALGNLNGTFYHEDDLNLAISLKLKDELLALGYNVIMTHDGTNLPDDQYVTKSGVSSYFYVNERNQWIKDHQNEIDVVISIHCNKYTPDPSVKGTRYYILPYGTAYYSNKSELLAKNLCNAVATAFGKTPPAQKYHTEEYAILKTKIPTVLVESGFMTNEGDLQNLIAPAWQTTFAKGLAQGIKEYLTR